MLLAGNAINPPGKRDAVVLVKDCHTDNLPFLYNNRQIRYRSGRADLAAEGAVVLTVAQSRDQQRSVNRTSGGRSRRDSFTGSRNRNSRCRK